MIGIICIVLALVVTFAIAPLVNRMAESNVFGFTDGENRYTYPSFDETKIRSLLAVLSTLADFVIVDCTIRDL